MPKYKFDMEWLENLIQNKDKIAEHNITISSDDLQLLITFVAGLLGQKQNLEEDVEYWKEKYKELEDSLNNDYDPEIDIPQIHGENISW